MTVQELVLRILAATRPLIPFMLTAAGLSVLALIVLLHLSQRLWNGNRRFGWLSLFWELGKGDSLRLSCVWVKFLTALLLLLSFQKLSVMHYLLLLLPGAVWCLDIKAPLRFPGRVLWLMLELAGLLSANLLCGYIRDVDSALWYWMAYVLLSLFVLLFDVYLFLIELQELSSERRANIENN